MFFEHHGGDLSINLGPRQFFQELGAFFRFGIEKSSELPLRQQHRTGKASVVQTGKFGGHFQLVFNFIGENFAIGAASQFDTRNLQVTFWLVARAVLTPECAIGFASDFEFNFGQTFRRVAGHQVILRLRDGIESWCFVVQREANGVQQGGLSGTGWTGDGKQPVAGKRLCREINFPFPFQGVEVFQTQAENFHASVSPASVCKVVLNR